MQIVNEPTDAEIAAWDSNKWTVVRDHDFEYEHIVYGDSCLSLDDSSSPRFVTSDFMDVGNGGSVKISFEQPSPFHFTKIDVHTIRDVSNVGKWHVHRFYKEASEPCTAVGGHYRETSRISRK